MGVDAKLVVVCKDEEKMEGMVLVASGAVIEAAKTETAQRIAGKSVLVVEKALDELLADKPKEKK